MGKLSEQIARARKMSQSASTVATHKMSDEDASAMEMGYAYEAELGEYLHKPVIKYFKKFSPQSMGLLKRAASLADSFGLDYRLFCRVHFYWFHKWFRRPPKLYELSGSKSTFSATVRIKEYLSLSASGKVGKVSSSVMPSTPISTQELDQINQKRLAQLSKAWDLPANEVLKLFASVFDPAWIKKQPK